MAHPHGYTATQRAWARARLTRGSSTGEVWEIGSEYPEARLSIGADAAAGWSIQAPGVHPVHCELFWDGQSLWVADTYGVGGVFLDGARVGEWMQIQGPAELRFGHASLDVETSTPAHEQMASSPNHARPVTLTDMVAPPDRRSQPIFGGAASDANIPDLEAAATRVVASPLAEIDSERTRVASAHAAPVPAAPDLRPRLGGDPAAQSSEATRMVAMPSSPAPAHPLQHGLAPAAVVAPPPAPVAPSLGQPPPPAFAPAAPQLPALPDASIAPMAEQAPAMQGGSAFVGPPSEAKPIDKRTQVQQTIEGILEKLKPQSSAQVLEASGGAKKGQTIPTRTWIMLGVTVAAAVGLLLWESEPAEVAAPQQAQAQTSAPTAAVDPPAPTPPTAPPTPPTVAPTPVQDPGTPTPATADPSTPAADGSQPSTDGEGEAAPSMPSMQRQAADLYITGRYQEALALYRELQRQSPTDPAYSSMVRILEERVACVDGVGPGGVPCAE